MSHVGTGTGTGGAPGGEALSGRAARLTELLAAALREEGTDAESEKRAVAAFLAVRDLTATPRRTRRRDDWRPRPVR
ncbi:hypothetical protein ACWC24_31405 [Streptomyces sp. NPDC001443]